MTRSEGGGCWSVWRDGEWRVRGRGRGITKLETSIITH